MRKRLDFGIVALKKMCEIAGHEYESCIDRTKTPPAWDYNKTMTQEQSDEFEKWFMDNAPFSNQRLKKNAYGMFFLTFGFVVK